MAHDFRHIDIKCIGHFMHFRYNYAGFVTVRNFIAHLEYTARTTLPVYQPAVSYFPDRFDYHAFFTGKDPVSMKNKDASNDHGNTADRFSIEQRFPAHGSHCSDLFDTLPDAIFRVTLPSGVCTYFNAATIRLFDVPPDENKDGGLFIRQYIPPRHLNRFDTAWQDVINGKQDGPIEYQITKGDGTSRWVRQYVRIVRNDKERPVAADCIATDITDHINDSSEITALRKFPSENPNPVLRISLEGVITYYNAASKAIIEHWQYRRGKQVKGHWKQLVERVLSDGCDRTVEIRIADRIYSLTFTPVENSSFVNVYGTDITDQKLAFDEIEKLSKFPSENPNPVLRIDSEGNVIYANRASDGLLDFWNTGSNGRINETWRLLIRDILDEGVAREMELQIDDTWLSLSFAPVVSKYFVNIYGLDITSRKQIEMNLKYANNSLSAFRDIATLKNSDLTTICDTTLNSIIRITRSTMGILGFLSDDESEIIIKSIYLPLIPEDIVKKIPTSLPVEDTSVLADSIRYRKAIINNNRNEITPAPGILPEKLLNFRRIITIPIFSENRIVAIAGVANREDEYTETDVVHVNALCESVWAIIERIHVENALRENTAKYQGSFQEARDAIIVFSTERKVLDGNRSLSTLSGYSQDELPILSLSDLFPNADPEASQKRMFALSCGETIPVFEEKMHAKKGAVIPVEIAIATIRNCYGNDMVFQGTIRDITIRKKAEDAVRNSQRLESLGVLAGGIAHDFNNLLSGIFGNLDLALDSIDDKTQVTAYLEKSINALSRAKELTQQLLTFSRGGAPCKSSVSLEGLIQEAGSLAMSGSTIKCSIHTCDGLYNIDADPVQIRQVLNDLLLNARQAMPHGGTINIDANNTFLTDNQVPTLSEGYYVALSIADEGMGIPEEVLPKIYDPFFTTKSNGSGLGLSTCHSIMTRHKGGITIKSTEGTGTVVTLYLPAAPKAEHSDNLIPTTPQLFHGKVLVMDDEELLRDVATGLFEQLGMDVVCARDGEEAVVLFKAALDSNAPFTLVFLDLTVPGGMGGEQTMAEIRQLSPAATGIVASGYADSPILSQPQKYGFAGKIGKPFRKAELQQVLEAVFHKTGSIT